MDPPATAPDRNPIEHQWDELEVAVGKMGDLWQVLLDKWTEILAEHPQRLVASMHRTPSGHYPNQKC